ncbi:MAG: flagellar basal body rod protein FlgC [Lachnospiraceae bacterium]|nr:flagellar basal body rod protein FlgC [Lachnospiraceae bacterium]
MGMFDSFNINASGLTAQRYRMDVIAENIANANTTRTEDGSPYKRKVVTFEEKNGNNVSFDTIFGRASSRFKGHGVKVSGTFEDNQSEGNMVYDPSHPDADENGYVIYPNVNIITEMTNLIDASRTYEANATAFDASKKIAQQGLTMGQS